VIVFLDTSEDLKVCSSELGCDVYQLLTPLTRFKPQYPDEIFAVDNGAFSGFERDAFLKLLDREEPRKTQCKFVAVPDVVGSARRTLEAFDYWYCKLESWPLALVCQDGQEDLPIPWNYIEAVFIGGSTEWKLSESAVQIIRTAQLLDKWIHVGRVNTPNRFDYFQELKVDSIDGTGLARFTYMRKAVADKNNLFRPGEG
jgi:hypothetical protein